MSITTSRGLALNSPNARRRRFGDLGGAWLFLVGASVAVDVPVVGRLMGPDILCSLGLLVLLVLRGKRQFTREAKVFLVMAGIWLAGAVITDLIRETPAENFVRGWFKIISFAITFVYLYLTTKGKLFRIMYFIVGLSLGVLLAYVLVPDEYLHSAPWKFGYGPAITIVVMICISTPFFTQVFGLWGQIAVATLMAVVNLMGESRAVFGILLATGLIAGAGRVFKIALRGRPVPKPVFALCLLGGIVLYQGVVMLYGAAATNGLLGPEALEKYEMQTRGDTGLLLGGRAESLVSTQAIADSPIIGHGSWASDYTYVNLYLALLERRGLQIAGDPYADSLIPSHSFLLGSWVEAGILGGVFWIYVFAVCGRSLFSLLHIPSWSRPFVAFTVLSLMWDVLFSPFGAHERFSVAAEFCVVLWAIRNENPQEQLGFNTRART